MEPRSKLLQSKRVTKALEQLRKQREELEELTLFNKLPLSTKLKLVLKVKEVEVTFKGLKIDSIATRGEI